MSHTTSWSPVAPWYDKLVSETGSYFHEHVILPKILKLLNLNDASNVFDVGCGQGVLARALTKNISYTGIDLSEQLIQDAKKRDQNPRHRYIVADATKEIHGLDKTFSHAVFLLSLQNMEYPEQAIANVSKLLKPNGILVIVLNHPCFRIPRQSSWGIDQQNKLQYRKINRYLSPLKIPITMHPGKGSSPVTWTYHFPLSEYSKWLSGQHFCITLLEEWTSDKESVGKAGRMENRSRSEFPLFLAIQATKML